MSDREERIRARRAKRRRKRIITRTVIIAAVILLAAGGLYYWKIYLPSKNVETYVYKETAVEQGDMDMGFEESGSVSLTASYISYDLNLDTSDDDSDDDDDEDTNYLKIEEVYAVQGQRISEGDPLFKLTDSSVRSVRRILEANVSDAAVDLADASSEYTLESQEAANTASSSKVAASVAGETYETTIGELQNEMETLLSDIDVLTRDIEICEANITNEDYKEAFDKAALQYQNAKKDYEATSTQNAVAYAANQSTYITKKNTYDSYVEQYETWRDTIESDKEQIAKDQEKYQQDAQQLEYKMKAAEGQKSSSELEGTLASETYNNTVNSLSESVKEAQSTYDEAESALEDFNAFVGDDNIVYSDGSGLVTEVRYEEGDELTSSGTMLAYTKDDGYTISVDVSEEDIPDVSIGEEVTIVFSAYPDETYSGTVSVIDMTTSDNHSSTVSYPVTVAINGDTSKLYGGMTADVSFITDSIPDTLYVSSKAIVSTDDGDFVYVSDGNEGYTLKQVEIGISDGLNTQILSGLAAGDTVYIRSTATENTEDLKDTSVNQEAAGGETTDSESSGDASGSGMPGGGNMPTGGMPSGGGMPGGGMPGGNGR